MNRNTRRGQIGTTLMAVALFAFSCAAEVVTPGEWTSDFNSAKSMADTSHVPMLVFWGNPGCPFCKRMKSAMDADEFIAWQADRKIIMVEVDGDLSVKAFVKNSTGQFPYMCVYWNKEDGQVVKTLFSGRSGKMPATSGTLARQLIDSVEMDIADYSSSKYNGGTFVVGNAANSRLESEIGLTEHVDVPLTRETSGVATNWIDVAGAKTEIVWTDNETNKAFRYAIPAQTAAGKIPLTLYDADGTTAVATSAITCTNRPNAISYPYWLGERTAATLNYGEWTMDLAAGKVSFTATTADGAPGVSLELFTSPFGRYGDTNNVVSLAKGAGTLTTAIDAATIASNVYLRVGAYPNATGSDTRGKDTYSFADASSLFDVTVTSTLILVPEQISQTVTLGTTSVAMEIAEGSLYKLSGFDATSLATYFTASNDLYVAKATNAAATLNLASSATEVSYQLWRPGVVQFAKASDRMMEMDGSGTVTVTRTGGKSGAITVSVSVDDGANGTKRVSVSPTTLTWPEGDTMAKTVTCTIQQHAGFNKDEVFTLSLAADDATQFGAQKTLALTVTDTDKPVLASDAFTVNAFIKTKEEIAYDVFNIQGNGTLTLKKSGSLPSGMKLAYNKKTRKVVLSGTPKKSGTYKTTITLKERRNGKYETGPATTFTIIVRDPSSSSSMAGYGVANAYYGKSLSQEIPLINPENGRMEGLLSVAISKANRVSARYTNLNNKKTSFSGVVNGYDAGEGLIASEMSKSSSQCAVALSSDGSLSAKVIDAVRDVTLLCEGVDIAAAANKSAYAGTYTVTFPRAGTNAAEVAAGTAYATLKITSAGTARYSGVMPNGTTFSGSTKIIAGEDAALVSVFKTSKSGTISALLNVLPNAKEQYESNNPAIIQAEEGTVPFWSCTKGIATEEELKAYGGYYAKDINLESLCTELYAKSVFTLDLGVGELDWTGSATQIASVPDIEVTVKKSSFSLQASKGVSFSKSSSTGILSGKVPLTLANGKTLKAKFKGILLLGWEDCNCGETPIVSENRPFASGTCYFTDTMNGVKVTRSIPVDLNVKTDCEE